MGEEARQGHRQLMLQQLAGQLQGRQAITDCVIQCRWTTLVISLFLLPFHPYSLSHLLPSDGDHYTSTLLLASLSPALAPLLAVGELF